MRRGRLEERLIRRLGLKRGKAGNGSDEKGPGDGINGLEDLRDRGIYIGVLVLPGWWIASRLR